MSHRIYEDRLTFKLRLRRFFWGVIYTTLFRWTPRWILDGWRVFLLRSFGSKIGTGCRIAPSCRIWAPWNLEMGNQSALAEAVDCYSVDKIIIGNSVCISQRSFLCTASHDINFIKRPLIHSPINIQDHSWVCAEAFVGPGVQIGEGAVIAARAMVVKNVEPWSVVGGNPARFLKRRKVV